MRAIWQIGARATFIAFWAMALGNPDQVAKLWADFRDWPLLAQGVVALLLLAGVLAIWVWQTDWPLAAHLAIDHAVTCATVPNA